MASIDVDKPSLPSRCDFEAHATIKGLLEHYGGVGKFATQYVCMNMNCGTKFAVPNDKLNDSNFIEERFDYAHFLLGIPTTGNKNKFKFVSNPCESCQLNKREHQVESQLFAMKINVCSKCKEVGAEPMLLVKAADLIEYPKSILSSVKIWDGKEYITLEEWMR